MRCKYVSEFFGKSKFMTTFTDCMSMPRVKRSARKEESDNFSKHDKRKCSELLNPAVRGYPISFTIPINPSQVPLIPPACYHWVTSHILMVIPTFHLFFLGVPNPDFRIMPMPFTTKPSCNISIETILIPDWIHECGALHFAIHVTVLCSTESSSVCCFLHMLLSEELGAKTA